VTDLSRAQTNLLAVLSVHTHDVHGPALARQLDGPVAGVHRNAASLRQRGLISKNIDRFGVAYRITQAGYDALARAQRPAPPTQPR
jgi:DNA-binding IclR family transcriptional regulator